VVGYIVVVGQVCDFFDVGDKGWGDETVVQPASECAFFISIGVGFCVWVKVSISRWIKGMYVINIKNML
jgi:hypothetical protein